MTSIARVPGRCAAVLVATASIALASCQPYASASASRPGMEAVRDTINLDRARPIDGTDVADGLGVFGGTAAVARAGWRLATAPVELPEIEREFRGVWVATVSNIDWPSRRDLTTAQAQAELLRILDHARDLGLNAVIFQVRPAADALYASELEPWSEFLTGTQGRAPQPFWDPLEFAVREAHARGLELHAWFNPFRAGFVSQRNQPASSHVRRSRPAVVRRYGRHYWMDPAEPEARRQTLAVISDVVRRYDIDAVHLDDYFYPYQERDSRGRAIRFPDDATWQRYGARTGKSRGDWRRSNIDAFIEQLYGTVHDIKPHVRVGISPFGIWRPGHPASVRGLDAYTELFADSRKWLENGWLDYLAPQLYWRTNAPQQSYTALLQWWTDQNRHGRHIVAGNIPNNVTGRSAGWRPAEILEQVRLTREQPGATGNIHFSASGLLRNSEGLGDQLRDRIYTSAALVPASPWLALGRPAAPELNVSPRPDGSIIVRFPDVGVPAKWVVRARWGDDWTTTVVPGGVPELELPQRSGRAPDLIALTAVDRAGIEGDPAVMVREP